MGEEHMERETVQNPGRRNLFTGIARGLRNAHREITASEGDADSFVDRIGSIPVERRTVLKIGVGLGGAVLVEKFFPGTISRLLSGAEVHAQGELPLPAEISPTILTETDFAAINQNYEGADALTNFAINDLTVNDAFEIDNPIPFDTNAAIQQEISRQLGLVRDTINMDAVRQDGQILQMVLPVNRGETTGDTMVGMRLGAFVTENDQPPRFVTTMAFTFDEAGGMRFVHTLEGEVERFVKVGEPEANAFGQVDIALTRDKFIVTTVVENPEEGSLVYQSYASDTGRQGRFVEAGQEDQFADDPDVTPIPTQVPVEVAMAQEPSEGPPTELMNRSVVSYQETEVAGKRIAFASTIPGVEFGAIDQAQLAQYLGPDYLDIAGSAPYRIEYHHMDEWQGDREELGGPETVAAFIHQDRVAYIWPINAGGFREDDGTQVLRFYISPTGLDTESQIAGQGPMISAFAFNVNIFFTLTAMYQRHRDERWDSDNIAGQIWFNTLQRASRTYMPVIYNGRTLTVS